MTAMMWYKTFDARELQALHPNVDKNTLSDVFLYLSKENRYVFENIQNLYTYKSDVLYEAYQNDRAIFINSIPLEDLTQSWCTALQYLPDSSRDEIVSWLLPALDSMIIRFGINYGLGNVHEDSEKSILCLAAILPTAYKNILEETVQAWVLYQNISGIFDAFPDMDLHSLINQYITLGKQWLRQYHQVSLNYEDVLQTPV